MAFSSVGISSSSILTLFTPTWVLMTTGMFFLPTLQNNFVHMMLKNNQVRLSKTCQTNGKPTRELKTDRSLRFPRAHVVSEAQVFRDFHFGRSFQR